MKPNLHLDGASEQVELESEPLLPAKRTSLAGRATPRRETWLSIWPSTASGGASLQEHFGHRLLVLLFASQHLLKGFGSTLTAPAEQFLYKAYRVRGPRMQIYRGVTHLPMAMKPIIGLISDVLPICGFHKAPYALISSFLGVVACAAVGFLPPEQLGVECLVMCLFLMKLQVSTCDLLSEAKYSEKLQSKPERGPDLVTFVWFGVQAGDLLAIALVGSVMTRWGTKIPFLMALLPAAFVILPVAGNYMEEVPQSEEDVAVTRHRLFEQREACVLCLLMFVGTCTLTVLGIRYESAVVNASAALFVALVMLLAFSLVLRPVIAKVNAFFLVQQSLSISVGGAAFYFYTDSPEQYPEGPHFSMFFYTSVLGVFGAVCSLLGIYTYHRYASEWTYRRLLLVSNVAASLLGLSDVVLFARLNVRMGLPDYTFVLGSSVFNNIIDQWMWMPAVLLLSQLCPRGMEATMYALLAGCHNLGSTIASSLGALVLELLGCEPGGMPRETAQFQNLWVGSALSTLLPLLTLALIPCLIPDVRQTDKLLEDSDRDATVGSLWKRWTSRDELEVSRS